MKKTLVMSLLAVMSAAFMACGGGNDEISTEAASTWSLVEDDGIGVLFTSYDETGSVAAQVKMYDNELRKILNDETFGGTGASAFELDTISARIYLFGVKLGEETIDQIVCDYEKGSNTTLQLAFPCYIDDSDPDAIVETFDPTNPGIRSCIGGVPWQKLIHMAHLPLSEDRTLYCTGGNKTFYVDLFREVMVNSDEFTMFFDFIADTFRGRMVVTEVGQDASEANSAVVNFIGLD